MQWAVCRLSSKLASTTKTQIESSWTIFIVKALILMMSFIPYLGCGGTSTAPSGTIISPMYPNNYFNNIECEWKIQVPGSSDRIILYFDDFNVQTWFAQSHR